MARILILLGPPGAGKGTQAERLSRALSLPHVATGDLLREHQREDTEVGRRARRFMDAGRLVPDAVVVDMLFDRLGRPDARAGCVLDGFPRTLPQAEALERRLGTGDTLAVLSLAVPKEALVERLSGRRTCTACGGVHHVRFDPPRVPGRCDRCGGELVQREDDRPEVVRQRLAVYEEQTWPVVDFYAARGVLTEVDGDRSPEEVFADLSRAARGEAA